MIEKKYKKGDVLVRVDTDIEVTVYDTVNEGYYVDYFNVAESESETAYLPAIVLENSKRFITKEEKEMRDAVFNKAVEKVRALADPNSQALRPAFSRAEARALLSAIGNEKD